MATQTVEFRAATGQTITAKLFAFGSDTEVASVSATEATNRKGTYRAAYTDVAAGEYQLIAFNATPVPVASWWVTLAATTATYEVYDKANKLAIADSVHDELMSEHTIDGSYGAHFVRSDNKNLNTVQITGAKHIAADVHEFQAGVITAGDFAADAITATVIAASAVTEIQTGLATATGVTTAFTEIKGTGWSSATDTLEQIRDASGGSGDTIMVTPVVAQTPVRVVGTNIETFIGDLSDIRVGVFSGEDPVDLSGLGDIEICVQTKGGVDLDFVEMADITIDGTDNNYFSWAPSGPSVSQVRSGAKWSLRKSSNKQVIAYGAWIVVDAALEDTGS